VLYYPRSLAKLIEELERLPSIGPKSAQRLALHLLRCPPEQVRTLASVLLEVLQQVKRCSICFNYTEEDPCALCQDPRRDASLMCVVADPRDMIAIENTGEYRGRYHVLGGLISPMDGVMPEDLRVKELLARLQDQPVQEIILALNPIAEGDVTAIYIARLVRPLGIRTTRLALGLPVGGDLDYVDQVTIARALEGRREI
jgi:recombination protein RecR